MSRDMEFVRFLPNCLYDEQLPKRFGKSVFPARERRAVLFSAADNDTAAARAMETSRSLLCREQRIASSSLRSLSIHAACSDPNLWLDHGDWTFLCEETPVVDQKETGTCWMQAGLSLLASLALKQGFKLRFSSAYLAFYDKLDKARVFLQNCLRSDVDERTMWHLLNDAPIQDGGTWGMFFHLVHTYGLVPHDSFISTYQSMHSSQLNGYLNGFLRSSLSLIREQRTTVDQVMLRVHDALLRAYSLPPEVVQLNKQVHGVDFTGAATALQDVIGITWESTVLAHAPDRPNGMYIGPYSNDPGPDGASQDAFHVVDMDLFWLHTVQQLRTGRPVWFTADVQYDFSSSRGLAMEGLHDVATLLNLKQGDRTCKTSRMRNRNTAPVHAMLFTGVKLDAHGIPTQWRIQNSWGVRGSNKGFVTVSHKWFESNVFQVAIDTRLLESIDSLLKVGEPKHLPPWDIFATVAS